MATDTDPRFGIDRWGASTDLWPGRVGWRNLLAIITSKAAIALQSTVATRPAAGISGRIHKALDTGRYSWDDGTTWQEISPVGGGGTPNPIVFGQAGAEGSSRIAMRADATIPTPDWPVRLWRYAMSDDLGVQAGSERSVFSATVPNAPAGRYLLGFTAIVGTQSVSADAFTRNYLRFRTGDPSTPSNEGQLRADCDRKAQPSSYTTVFTWNGGNLFLNLRASPESANLQFYGTANGVSGGSGGVGTDLWAAYLGPVT